MKTLKRGLTAAVLAMSIAAGSAYAGIWGSCEAPYRVYYVNSSCHYFYIDANGNRVVDGKYVNPKFMGLTLRKDCCSNRWYYEDAMGTRHYVVRHCG
jgi:hypothetical protein